MLDKQVIYPLPLSKVSFFYKMVKNRMNKDLKTERGIRGASPFTTPS